jgi:thiamine phosphate synthase YjbQ (UPF0047 family)
MRQHVSTMSVATSRGLTEITGQVREAVRASGVRRDPEAFLSRLVRDGVPLFTHVAEGDDDMPSHVKAALTKTSEQIPIERGELHQRA